MAFFKMKVDASNAINLMQTLSTNTYQAQKWMLGQFRRQAPILLVKVFADAIPTGSKGFPPQYELHLLSAVARLSVEADVYGATIYALINLDNLGTYEDLITGFHRHALGADGQVIELPYIGQVLKNSADIRYNYWIAVVDGDSEYIGLSEAGNIVAFPIPAGSYEDTVEDRVAVWGNKAPEWLLLNYGIDYYPPVAPYPLKEEIEAQLGELWLRLSEQVIAQVAGQAALTPGFSYDIGGRPGVTIPHIGRRWVKVYKGG